MESVEILRGQQRRIGLALESSGSRRNADSRGLSENLEAALPGPGVIADGSAFGLFSDSLPSTAAMMQPWRTLAACPKRPNELRSKP